MTFDQRYADYKAMIEPALGAYFPANRGFPFDGLLSAMDYSLMAGGKRIRPVLVLELCRVCGGDVSAALPVACAVEMLHTYSLIHDDLPCMDNDELRRGKPTCHKVYGECTATLAGDALQAEAFGTIARCALPPERRAGCLELLAGAAGVDGICGGQYMDMVWEGRTLTESELSDLQARKTGSLLSAVMRLVHDEVLTLPQAVATVTRNPARASGMADRGELTPGLRADLVQVHMAELPGGGRQAVVRGVWREGQRVL